VTIPTAFPLCSLPPVPISGFLPDLTFRGPFFPAPFFDLPSLLYLHSPQKPFPLTPLVRFSCVIFSPPFTFLVPLCSFPFPLYSYDVLRLARSKSSKSHFLSEFWFFSFTFSSLFPPLPPEPFLPLKTFEVLTVGNSLSLVDAWPAPLFRPRCFRCFSTGPISRGALLRSFSFFIPPCRSQSLAFFPPLVCQ